MSYLRTFEQEDVLVNTLVTYPQFEWIMLSGNIYLNDRRFSGGSNKSICYQKRRHVEIWFDNYQFF